jgi:hypothetical protein
MLKTRLEPIFFYCKSRHFKTYFVPLPPSKVKAKYKGCSFLSILAHAKGVPRSRGCARKNYKLHVSIKVLAISDNFDHFSFFTPTQFGGGGGSPQKISDIFHLVLP